ncbi:unnamed protein product [Phytophthora lilii]|uniref:Unnamed protein product n=1 Tax=Phytophthora lilii TaxID=2077276 RepID=A0A9W6TJW3_9STRA|nr:unnamed protein product [Phytophthora lilii]
MLQILFGSFPIAQAREPFSAVRFIAESCSPRLDEVYKLKSVDDDNEWSPYSLCEAYAKLRGFHPPHVQHATRHAGNKLLRDTLDGKKLVLAFPPPAEPTSASSPNIALMLP